MNKFDTFCSWISKKVSHATFFSFCTILVVVWLIEGVVKMVLSGPSAFFDSTYQLQINTTTTIITFLMVALLQNSQQQFENAINAKLDTILKGVAEIEDTNSEMLENMIGAEKTIGAHEET